MSNKAQLIATALENYTHYEQMKKKLEKEGISLPVPFELGKPYMIRTVTMIYTGQVYGIIGDTPSRSVILLRKAAWISDAGRWSDCLNAETGPGTLKEVEPYNGVVRIWTHSMLDAVEYAPGLGKLPVEPFPAQS